MIKNISVLIIVLILTSCQNNNIVSLTLYKSNGLIDKPFDVLESTFWDYKNENDLDSLNINQSSKVFVFNELFENIKMSEYTSKPFLHPEYAIILTYKKRKDTIYLDESIIEGYVKQKKIMFTNTNDLMFKFLQEEDFITNRTKYFRKQKMNN